MDISKLSIRDNEDISINYMYTGASCINSGTHHARTAICICLDADEYQTVIEDLDFNLSAIYKAELYAIYRALSMIIDEQSVVIVSRSDYAVKCINVWSNTWRKNDWIKTPKSSKCNIDLIKDIEEIINKNLIDGKSIRVTHSSQISDSTGNRIAQTFAKQYLIT